MSRGGGAELRGWFSQQLFSQTGGTRGSRRERENQNKAGKCFHPNSPEIFLFGSEKERSAGIFPFGGPGKSLQQVSSQVLSKSYVHYNLREILRKASRDWVLL